MQRSYTWKFSCAKSHYETCLRLTLRIPICSLPMSVAATDRKLHLVEGWEFTLETEPQVESREPRQAPALMSLCCLNRSFHPPALCPLWQCHGWEVPAYLLPWHLGGMCIFPLRYRLCSPRAWVRELEVMTVPGVDGSFWMRYISRMGKRNIPALLWESSMKNTFYLPDSVIIDGCILHVVSSRAEHLWKGEARS